jgi:ABC-type dipeptide/oligopeptide/nickel transport system permease component
MWSMPVVLLLTFVVFSLMRIIPGGPFDFSGGKSLPRSVVENLEWPLLWQFGPYGLVKI